MQRLARRVVAQASLSCRCAAIHLLAPYREVLQFSPRPYWMTQFPRISKGSKLLPPLKRAGERHLVYKLQMPADRDAVRQAGDLDPKRLQKP